MLWELFFMTQRNSDESSINACLLKVLLCVTYCLRGFAAIVFTTKTRRTQRTTKKKSEIMFCHQDIERDLFKLLRLKVISFAGNRTLKIYGRLDCASGKRMKTMNRVFFKNEDDALKNGYRPCGNCMPDKFRKYRAFQQEAG